MSYTPAILSADEFNSEQSKRLADATLVKGAVEFLRNWSMQTSGYSDAGHFLGEAADSLEKWADDEEREVATEARRVA